MMESEFDNISRLLSQRSTHPKWSIVARRIDAVAQMLGVGATILRHGLTEETYGTTLLGGFAFTCMLLIAVVTAIRYRWSLARPSFFQRHRLTIVASIGWTVGLFVLIILGPALNRLLLEGSTGGRWPLLVLFSEFVIVLYALTGTVRGLRALAAGGVNPALLLIGSFLVVITIGTGLLMLPKCRAHGEGEAIAGAPFTTALFTSTSATCVTGLIVEPTGSYWSPYGQLVVCCLFQIGGLGIMTFGAFFALAAGRAVQLREFSTLRDLLAAEGMRDMRRQIFAIFSFTVVAELIGAVLISGYWSEEPLQKRGLYSLFHSISAFCNAGFSLTPNSFVNQGSTWTIGGVFSVLIIVGGLGFAALDDLWVRLRTWAGNRFQGPALNGPKRRHRLSLTTTLVVWTSITLLLFGTVSIYMLEHIGAEGSRISLSDAWFQSVTFRTAGFNTVELGDLQPSTKLFGIGLMFIGASPGSTGGGVKTVVIAIALLGIISVLRGRNGVECNGRSIPSVLLNRALAILFLGVVTTMTTTLLLTIFEGRPELFIDYLFEASSATGTVGVSSSVMATDPLTGDIVRMSITQSLSTASRMVIVVTMFLGRVGPLTLLMALAGQTGTARYEYPTERVTLG